MYKTMKNIFVIAQTPELDGSFPIYLIFSGKQEYLLTHRYSPELYAALKAGLRLEALSREQHRNRRSRSKQQLQSSLSHLMRVIDDYLIYELEAA